MMKMPSFPAVTPMFPPSPTSIDTPPATGTTFTSTLEKSRSWADARQASTIEIRRTLGFMGRVS